MNDELTKEQQETIAAYKALLAMSDMLDTMATQARLALGENPDTDQQRELEGQLLEIAGRKAAVEEKITLIKRKPENAPPTPTEAVAETAALVRQVENDTAEAMRADAAIKLAGDVIGLARQLAG